MGITNEWNSNELRAKRRGMNGFGEKLLSPEILCFPILPPVIYMTPDGIGYIPIVIDDDGDDDINGEDMDIKPPVPSLVLRPPPLSPSPSPSPPPSALLPPPPSWLPPQVPNQARFQTRTVPPTIAQSSSTPQRAPGALPNIPWYFQVPPLPPPLLPSRPLFRGHYPTLFQSTGHQTAQRAPPPPPPPPPPAAATKKTKWSDYVIQALPAQPKSSNGHQTYQTGRAPPTQRAPASTSFQPPNFNMFQPPNYINQPPQLRPPLYRNDQTRLPQTHQTDLNGQWASRISPLLQQIQWCESVQAAAATALLILKSTSLPPPPPPPQTPRQPTQTPPQPSATSSAPQRIPNGSSSSSSRSGSGITRRAQNQTVAYSNDHLPDIEGTIEPYIFPQQQPLAYFYPVTEVGKGRPRNYEQIKSTVMCDRFTSEEYSWLPPGWFAEERTRNTGRLDVFYHDLTEKQYRSKAAAIQYMKENGTNDEGLMRYIKENGLNINEGLMQYINENGLNNESGSKKRKHPDD